MKAKVCLVGEAAVGKASLTRRYVLDQYDDRYEAETFFQRPPSNRTWTVEPAVAVPVTIRSPATR